MEIAGKDAVREDVAALLVFCAFSAGMWQNRADFHLER